MEDNDCEAKRTVKWVARGRLCRGSFALTDKCEIGHIGFRIRYRKRDRGLERFVAAVVVAAGSPGGFIGASR